MPYASENGVVHGVLPTSVTALYIQVLPSSNPGKISGVFGQLFILQSVSITTLYLSFSFKNLTGVNHKKPKVNL